MGAADSPRTGGAGARAEGVPCPSPRRAVRPRRGRWRAAAMKFYRTTTVFEDPWETVTAAFWRKYHPGNPYVGHVEGARAPPRRRARAPPPPPLTRCPRSRPPSVPPRARSVRRDQPDGRPGDAPARHHPRHAQARHAALLGLQRARRGSRASASTSAGRDRSRARAPAGLPAPRRQIVPNTQAYILEQSTVDPDGKVMRTTTRNLNHTRAMSVVESQTFRVHPENSSWCAAPASAARRPGA